MKSNCCCSYRRPMLLPITTETRAHHRSSPLLASDVYNATRHLHRYLHSIRLAWVDLLYLQLLVGILHRFSPKATSTNVCMHT